MADYSTDTRKTMAKAGTARPDGSYPIANKADLHNAIQAFGRADNPSAVKAWIIRRARALGALGMLPTTWNVTK